MKTTTTKIIKNFILILTFPLLIITIGCSSSDDSNDENPMGLCSSLADVTTDYYNAVNSFQANPSTQTCNNLRDSALNLIEAAQNCQQFGTQYEGLEQAAQGWTDINCSQGF